MKVNYGVAVSKVYSDLGYEELVKVLKEVEGCYYGVTVETHRNTDEMGAFTGSYTVIVESGISGIKSDDIEYVARDMYNTIDEMTE